MSATISKRTRKPGAPRRAQKSGRKECEAWYVKAFCQNYLARYEHRSDQAAQKELPFLLKALKLRKGSRVLDLCCGAGRHSRALAGAGLNVVGIDLSSDLLKAARATEKKRVRARAEIEYIRADMRRLPLPDASVDGAISMFTSFGYFPTDKQNERVLREVQRVLKPGAPFIMDYLNLRATLKTLVPYSEKVVSGVTIQERRRYDPRSHRLIKISRFPCCGKMESVKESVRAYSAAELDKMFRQAGLKIERRFGDLSGARFDSLASPRIVLLARRK